jgi:hypothetical protein
MEPNHQESEMADQKKILAKPLIVADVVDCNGNCYPRETLEKMVEEYNKLPRDRQVWATRDFGQQTVDIQGYVSALNMNEAGIDADVEVLATAAGVSVMKVIDQDGDDAVEFVPAGFIEESVMVERDGREVRMITKAKLTGISIGGSRMKGKT